MIDQRILAIEAGVTFSFVLPASSPDEAKAEQLAREIELKREELERARAEAQLYSGGLVAAMKASTVATMEQTLAMLGQQYVMSRFGLAWPQLATGNAEKSSPRASAIPPQQIEILGVDARVTESNASWSRYAWKLKVRSLSPETLRLEAKIEFQDAQGFVIADANEYGLSLRPREEQTFTGYALIDASIAGNVATVASKVKSS